jgi:hypothetical protein
VVGAVPTEGATPVLEVLVLVALDQMLVARVTLEVILLLRVMLVALEAR